MPPRTDVGQLLRAARDRSRLSQSQLARESGLGRRSVNAYENGRLSPTVAALDRLLAACGLQARVLLEPLLADLDARVDALSEPLPELDGERWEKLVRSLLDLPGAVKFGLGPPPARRGPVSWAVDGPTALVLHQLAVPAEELGGMDAVVVLDEALRWWMRAVNLVGRDERDGPVQDWFDADLARITAALAGERYSVAGFLRLRVVDQLPATIGVAVPWWPEPVPVVTVDEVERSHPAYAELLARWRQRRESPRAAERP